MGGKILSATWILSAKFSRKSNLKAISDLERSLKKHSFINYIIFDHSKFISPNLKITGYKFSKINPLGLIPKAFRETLRRINNSFITNLFSKCLPNNKFLMIPHNLRPFYYQSLLKNLNEEDLVFLVDSRDLVFQENPNLISESLIQLAELHFFDEGVRFFKNMEPQFLGNSPVNMAWARLFVDDNSYDFTNIINNTIINGGCIFGRVKHVKIFVDIACNKIKNNKNRFHHILDQMIVNIPVFSGDLSSTNFKINKNGTVVLNMCGVIEENVANNNGVLQIENVTIPIIHQYDRFGNYSPENGIQITKNKYSYQNL
jgi:hypothetical protein